MLFCFYLINDKNLNWTKRNARKDDNNNNNDDVVAVVVNGGANRTICIMGAKNIEMNANSTFTATSYRKFLIMKSRVFAFLLYSWTITLWLLIHCVRHIVLHSSSFQFFFLFHFNTSIWITQKHFAKRPLYILSVDLIPLFPIRQPRAFLFSFRWAGVYRHAMLHKALAWFPYSLCSSFPRFRILFYAWHWLRFSQKKTFAANKKRTNVRSANDTKSRRFRAEM